MGAIDGWNEAILRLRKRAGLKQAEAATMAGLSQAQLSRYESGVASPSLKTLGRLLDAYQVDLAEFGDEAKKQAGCSGVTYYVFFGTPEPSQVPINRYTCDRDHSVRVFRQDGSEVESPCDARGFTWFLQDPGSFERAQEAFLRFKTQNDNPLAGCPTACSQEPGGEKFEELPDSSVCQCGLNPGQPRPTLKKVFLRQRKVYTPCRDHEHVSPPVWGKPQSGRQRIDSEEE